MNKLLCLSVNMQPLAHLKGKSIVFFYNSKNIFSVFISNILYDYNQFREMIGLKQKRPEEISQIKMLTRNSHTTLTFKMRVI